MKKLLVLFVAVAATITLSAKSMYYFNRTQFQWSSNPAKFDALVAADDNYDVQLTVPFVYKGTVTLKGDWAVEPPLETLSLSARQNAACLVSLKKTSCPAIMTLCQPCIDCYPCDVLDVEDKSEDGLPKDTASDKAGVGKKYTGIKPANDFGQPGWITIWNLYLVTEVNKKDKEVTVIKINLLSDDNKGLFFTGAKGKNIYVKASDADRTVQLQLTGAKNDYKFKYYERYLTKDGSWGDIDDDVKQSTAYIKSAKALNGTIYYSNNYLATYTGDTTADQVEVLDVAGTVKLTRNNGLTADAIKGAFGAEAEVIAKNWDDCTIVVDAETCEQYFADVFEDAYFGSAYKKYDIEIVDESALTFFEELYDAAEEFSYITGDEEEDED